MFYTAITRAKNKLKIYWTPEVEHKVLTNIKPRDTKKDVGILRTYLLDNDDRVINFDVTKKFDQ